MGRRRGCRQLVPLSGNAAGLETGWRLRVGGCGGRRARSRHLRADGLCTRPTPPRNLGSSRSRSALPSMFRLYTTIVRRRRPQRQPRRLLHVLAPVRLSSVPQFGISGDIPKPRKLKDASLMITAPMLMLNTTMIGAATLGSTWRTSAPIRVLPGPWPPAGSRSPGPLRFPRRGRNVHHDPLRTGDRGAWKPRRPWLAIIAAMRGLAVHEIPVDSSVDGESTRHKLRLRYTGPAASAPSRPPPPRSRGSSRSLTASPNMLRE